MLKAGQYMQMAQFIKEVEKFKDWQSRRNMRKFSIANSVVNELNLTPKRG